MDYLSRIQRIIGTGLMLAITSTGLAQDSKETVLQYIDDNASLYGEVAQKIWDWAEVGYLETQSSKRKSIQGSWIKSVPLRQRPTGPKIGVR